VGAALLAQRRTVVEPLGVFRESKPVRRRLLWRLATLAVGIAALLTAGAADRGGEIWSVLLVVGTLGILCGIAVSLPWLVERAVRRMRGGRPSWQLAVRRLQLDSGTPSRVVAGLAVMLAGAVALQSMLAVAAEGTTSRNRSAAPDPIPSVYTNPAVAPQIADALGNVPGVSSAHALRSVAARVPGRDTPVWLRVADCGTITWMYRVSSCHDGQVFFDTGYGAAKSLAGTTVRIYRPSHGGEPRSGPGYRVPSDLVPARPRAQTERSGYYRPSIMITPGAVRGRKLPSPSARVLVDFDAGDRAVLHRVYAALAPYGWHASMFVPNLNVSSHQGAAARRLAEVRSALLAGSLFVLLLAGASLLVLATEQVRERRRSLAALAASGVPRAVLARSMFWQTLIPVVVGTVAACAGGAVLGVLVLDVARERIAVDWPSMGLFAAAAVVLVLLVTLAALPLLRGVTRVESLRTE
jgi:hypothetical protein